MNVPELPKLELIHFDKGEVDRLIKACRYPECKDGPLQTDISALHDYLAMEKLTEAMSISGNVVDMNREIADIVKFEVVGNAKR